MNFQTVNAKFRQTKAHDFKIKGASKHTFLGMKRERANFFYIGLMAIFKWFVVCDPYLNQSSKALFFFFFENTEEKRKEKKTKQNIKQNHSSQSLQTDRQSANLFLRSRYWWTTHTFPFISLFPPSFLFLFSSSSFELILNKSDYSIPCV